MTWAISPPRQLVDTAQGRSDLACMEATEQRRFAIPRSRLTPHCRESSRIAARILYRQKLESLDYIFVAARVGASLFAFIVQSEKPRQMNPGKPTQKTDFSTKRHLNVIQGHLFLDHSKADKVLRVAVC